MGFFSRLLGTENEPPSRPAPRSARTHPRSADAQAIERYRYMVQTAPPETLEQAHAEAFAKLTPEQRRLVVQELAQTAPPQERAAIEGTSSEDPQALARIATRAEIRQPGVLERALSRPGLGFGGGLLSSFAAGFVGSLVAQSFFSALGGLGDANAADASGSADEGATDTAEGDTAEGDTAEGDTAEGDTAAEGGDDFGIGDPGGDDFGGGDGGDL